MKMEERKKVHETCERLNEKEKNMNLTIQEQNYLQRKRNIMGGVEDEEK